MSHVARVSGWLPILACVLVVQPVLAQTQRSGGDAATARVVQQLQQVTAEKTKLQQDNEALKKELDETKTRLSQANAEQSRLQQRTRQLEQSGGRQDDVSRSNSEALEKTRMQMQELVGKYRETAQTLKEVETDRDALRAASETRQRAYETCIDRNAQMYLLGSEVLDRYSRLGVWSAVSAKESFTQISRTRLENLADDYRDRINTLRMNATAERSKASASR